MKEETWLVCGSRSKKDYSKFVQSRLGWILTIYREHMEKFRKPTLRIQLGAMGDAVIHEDNPDDPFWGKNGKDMLGKLLMQVRQEIRGE